MTVPASTWIDLVTHPTMNGMYMVGKPAYSINVPFKGLPLLRLFIRNKLPADAKLEVDKRKQVFDSHQNKSLKSPPTWVTIGYVYGPDLVSKPTFRMVGSMQIKSGEELVPAKDLNGIDLIGTTVYYQISNPGYQNTDLVWDNWPTKPEVYTELSGIYDPNSPGSLPSPPAEAYPPDVRDL